jgi:hypothetical protein
MVTTSRNVSHRLKKISRLLADRNDEGYEKPASEILYLTWEEATGEDPVDPDAQKKILHIQHQYHHKIFKEWRMPEAPTGYLKPAKHDLL